LSDKDLTTVLKKQNKLASFFVFFFATAVVIDHQASLQVLKFYVRSIVSLSLLKFFLCRRINNANRNKNGSHVAERAKFAI